MAAKTAVQVRLRQDVVERIDEAAEVLRMSRAQYCAYVLSISHSEKCNPKVVAMQLIEAAAADE